MFNTKRSTRMLVGAAAVTALAFAGCVTAPETASATANAPRSWASSRCAETYVQLGGYTSFPSWFFGKTTLHFRNPKDVTAYVQWSSGPSNGEIDIPPGGSSDLSRAFAGLSVTIHPWGWVGVYVSEPNGPFC